MSWKYGEPNDQLRLTRPDRGLLLVVSGPSGVGKSTVLKPALERIPGLAYSVSATTRAPRPGEVEGVDYHFLDRPRFDALVAEGAFLEHAEVYDRSYGTLRAPTEAALAQGDSLILDIDVQGARQVRERMPEAVLVMLVPPDVDALEARLRARGTESEQVIQRRMELLDGQLGAVDEYDYVIVNDDREAAIACFQGIILAEACRSARRASWVARFRRLPGR
jgi:guanylate kinase